MGPKVEAACQFARATGGIAAIGALKDAAAVLRGEAGTTVSTRAAGVAYRDAPLTPGGSGNVGPAQAG